MVSANDLKRDVERTGDDAGQAWGEGFTRGADGRIRNARGQFVKAGQDLGTDMARGMGEGLDRGLPAFESGMSKAVAATRGYKDEFKKLQDLMRDRAPWEVVSQQSERVASAHNLARDAARGAGDAFKEFENAQKALSSSANGATGALSGLGGAMGNVGAGGPAAIAVVGALAVGVADLGGVAASAAQSLLLIPAAAGAAGAAIGTVALATYGFGDALKAVGDPKKFGEALKALSPDAQQAALSINALMPAFTQLRMATADAFFNNVGPQLNQLANQFLPTIQTLTTGIAGAMNQAFSGIAQQLMTPQTQQAIQTLTTNVVAAFQQLAPAVAPLTKALADLMAAGSGFLPELAKAATDAATAFSKFITEAKESGNLKKWMSEGLDTLKQLGEGAFVLGQMVMQLAPLGQQMLPDILTILKAIASQMPAIVFMLESMQAPLVVGAKAVDEFGKAFSGIKGVVEGVVNASIPLINKLGDALNTVLAPIRAAAKLIGMDIPEFSPLDNRGGGTVYKGAGVGGLGTAGLNTGATGPGGFGGLPTAGLSGVPNSGYAFPGTSWFPGQQKPGTWGGPPATKTGSSSALPAAPALPYDTSLPPGFAGVPQTTEVVSAENTWMDARHTLAEKQARLQQLEKTVGATADDITKAKNDVINAQQAQQQAEMRLYDTQNKQLKAQTAALSEFGVKLDQDLGISKGLAGIADNLVRFLGSLAVAPWEAQMNAIANAPGQAQGGFGLIGQLGAQGAFGPQYTAAGQAAAANGGGASALGPAALIPGGAYPGDAALLANVPAGRYSQTGNADLTKGLGDCSSAVEDLVNIMDGRPTGGRSMSTGNEAQWLTEHGFQPGMGGPGDFRVGFNGGHTQATLPGGTPFNWGSDSAAARRGIGGTGADDPAFTSHYYRPAGATSGAAAAPTISVGAPGESVAPSGFGGLPIPLPVTIVGGGGGFGTPGGAPIGTPGGGPGGGGGGGAPDPYAPATTYPTSPGSPGFSSGDITNPALTNPPAPGASPGGWGMPGLPTGAGGAGQGPFLGAPGPGVGAAAGGPGAGPTRIGGGDGLSGSGKGGIGASDSTMALAGMAASALDVMAPGAGQAAQTAMKLANRAIQYGGQVAGIAAQGAIDTFIPFGGSKLASNSWATKLIGGIAGAAPALPNMAGKPAGPPAPGSPASGNGSGPAPGPGGDTNITVNNNRPTEDGTGRDVAHAMQNQYQPPAKP